MLRKEFVFILLLSPMLMAYPSTACESNQSTRVIGFSTDGKVVVLRKLLDMEEGSEAQISIELYDLSRKKKLKTFSICDSELDCDRSDPSASRRSNWRRISRKLKKEGFVLNPDYPKSREFKPLGAKLVLETRKSSDFAMKPKDLYLVTKKSRRLLIKGADPGSSTVIDSTRCEGVFVDPKQNYIFTVSGGCTSGEVKVMSAKELNTSQQ